MADLSTNQKHSGFIAGMTQFFAGFLPDRATTIKRQFAEMQEAKGQTPAVVLTEDAAVRLGVEPGKSVQVMDVIGEGDKTSVSLYGGLKARLADIAKFGESRDFVAT